MQRPLEEETKQEDRPELPGRGVRTSPLAPLAPPPSLPWGTVSVSSPRLCVIHTCAQKAMHVEKPHMQLQTCINKKQGGKKRPMKSNFPLSHTHYSKLVCNHKSSQCF